MTGCSTENTFLIVQHFHQTLHSPSLPPAWGHFYVAELNSPFSCFPKRVFLFFSFCHIRGFLHVFCLSGMFFLSPLHACLSELSYSKGTFPDPCLLELCHLLILLMKKIKISWSFTCMTIYFTLLSVLLLFHAAAAKLLQLCPTLCDPIDGSPPGSSVHGIFQARVLECGAIAFSSNKWDKINEKMKYRVQWWPLSPKFPRLGRWQSYSVNRGS